jgi:hypothetical protein
MRKTTSFKQIVLFTLLGGIGFGCASSDGVDEAVANSEETPAKTVEAEKPPENLLDVMFGQTERQNIDEAAILSKPLGSRTNPVRAFMPEGQHEYLSRLRCADRKRPKFSRTGSYGPGPWGSIIDGYEVSCKDGFSVLIFMDMYHPDYRETQAVEGFTIRR